VENEEGKLSTSVIQTLDLESVRREIRRYGRYGDIKNNHKGTE